MLTGMSEDEWTIAMEVFKVVRSFLEAVHYFTVHNITWRALPAETSRASTAPAWPM
jgi:hypothetical protein